MLSLCEGNDARLKDIEPSAAIHLVFDELQLGDLEGVMDLRRWLRLV
jgi:hypothetical protein